MTDAQSLTYFIILTLYSLVFYVTMMNRKESKFQNFLTSLAVILAFALVLYPLFFFYKPWNFVAVPSGAVVIATIFVEFDLKADGGSNSKSVNDSVSESNNGWTLFHYLCQILMHVSWLPRLGRHFFILTLVFLVKICNLFLFRI